MKAETSEPQLSIVLRVENTAGQNRSLLRFLPGLRGVLARLDISHEILVVMIAASRTSSRTRAASTRNTSTCLADAASPNGCRVLDWSRETETGGKAGYGATLKRSLGAARGRFVVTMDIDLSHDPQFLEHMWAAKDTADIIIGSRYVPGGQSRLPLARRLLSRTLNNGLASLLSLPVRDLSSSFRMYSRAVIDALLPELKSDDYDILEEIVVRAYCGGRRIREVPLRYRPRHLASSNRIAVQEARAFLRNGKSIWRLRNDANSCDYDARAFNSRIWPQRYWQRRRFDIITGLMRGGGLWLDIACGSSQIIRSHPAMVGFDINSSKLRYLKSTNKRLVRGTMFRLPFRDACFDGVVCSEVIEHVPKDHVLFREMRRVLKPGGSLVLGTPDYDSTLWNIIERAYGILMPASYAEEHISHYTRAELEQLLRDFGFTIQSFHSIVNSEIIFMAQKTGDELP